MAKKKRKGSPEFKSVPNAGPGKAVNTHDTDTGPGNAAVENLTATARKLTETQPEIPAGEPEDIISRLVQTDTFGSSTERGAAPETDTFTAPPAVKPEPKPSAPPAAQEASMFHGPVAEREAAQAFSVSLPEPAAITDNSLDDIFSRLDSDAQAKPAVSAGRRKGSPAVADEKKSLRLLREKLLELGWSRGDVYKLSLKFFGKRISAEIDEDYRNLLNSLHYLEVPEENRELALKVLLDEITNGEAVKSSLLKLKRRDLRLKLEVCSWAQGRLDEIVAKYADEKTAEEIITRYHIILADLPHDKEEAENYAFAVDILLDASRYDENFERAGKRVYALGLAREFEDIPQELSLRLTDKYWNSVSAAELGEMSDRISSEIRHGEHPRNYVLSLRVLTGELTQDEAFSEARRRKNVDDIAALAAKMKLDAETASKISGLYTGAGGSWFDAEFPRIYSLLYSYRGASVPNALLAVKVMTGEISEDQARTQSLAGKNAYDLGVMADEISLAAQTRDAMAGHYAINTDQEFALNYRDIFLRFPENDGIRRFAPVYILGVIIGSMPLERAVYICSVLNDFDVYSVAPEDAERLADKYLDKKSTAQLKAEYESVLSKIPYIETPQENEGLALDVLLDGSTESLNDAVDQGGIVRERYIFQRELNKYGWFMGYAGEITDRFLGRKSVDEVINGFKLMLESLPCAQAPEDNIDIVRKALLGRMSDDEVRRQAEFRKALSEKRWAANCVNDIVSGYLGTLKPDQAVAAMDERLGKYSFWNKSGALNRYALDLVLDELNGQARELPVTLAMSLLEQDVPLDGVKKIYALLDDNGDIEFNPEEITRYYAETITSGAVPADAVEKVMALFHKTGEK